MKTYSHLELSKTFAPGLSNDQHIVNAGFFKEQHLMLTATGFYFWPAVGKRFQKEAGGWIENNI